MFKVPTALVALSLLLGACSSPGALQVTSGGLATNATTFDFGPLAPGRTRTFTLTLQNTGSGPLTLTGFEKVSGDAAVQARPGVDELGAVFLSDLGASRELFAGERMDVPVTFAPPASASVPTPYGAVLTLRAANAVAGKDAVTVTLAGRAAEDPCALPEALDFGAVARGDTATLQVVIENAMPTDGTGFVGEPMQSAGGLFSLTPESPRGAFPLGPGAQRVVSVVFAPTEARESFGSLELGVPGCPTKQVLLRGTGVDQTFTWTPSTVDFGYAPPGARAEREVRFENWSFREVHVSDLGTFEGSAPSAVFVVAVSQFTVPGATRDASTNELVPGTWLHHVQFTPSVLGPRTATLRATTDLPRQQSVVVPLRGVGGGPLAEVSPAPVLDFERMAYFASTTPANYAVRRVTVRNVGTSAPGQNLKLGADIAGTWSRPYWSVRPLNADSSLSEVCVGAFDEVTQTCLGDVPSTGPGAYDPLVGIDVGRELAIPVRVTPSGVGMKAWELQLFSNDLISPVTTLTITANVVVLPPCNFTVTPMALPFGVVAPGERKELSVRVRNNGSAVTDVCLLSNVEIIDALRPPPSPVFSVVNAPAASVMLQAGDEREFVVRAAPTGVWPMTPTPVTGYLSFWVSNPVASVVRVALTSEVGRGCLTVVPEAWDFGTVGQQCGTPTRAVTIWNSCGNVSLTQVDLPLAAGEPANGPHCPGSSPCPEFTLASPPTLPLSLPTASTPLQVQYRAINTGKDQGLLRLRADEAGVFHDYTVVLAGTGDAQGLNTDSFSVPKVADVLLLIDDSLTMANKVAAIAQQFTALTRYATANQVDFHIGVAPAGGHPDEAKLATAQGTRFVRPNTPSAAQVFSQLVNLGGHGGRPHTCIEPALWAVTSPYVTDPAINQGLVRPDASLNIVCFTDTLDWATPPVPWYVDRLRAVKGTQRAELLSYSVVGPFLPTAPPPCQYNGLPDDGKHAYAAAQLHGTTEEICSTDWAATMERVGRVAFGQRDAFFLRARPDPMGPPVTVTVDGVPVPPTQGTTTVWTYDPVDNGVHFTPNYLPVVGQSVVVNYQVACLP